MKKAHNSNNPCGEKYCHCTIIPKENLKSFEMHTKALWYYQIDEWSKPNIQIVYIAGEPSGNRVRVYRKDENNKTVEGGYINVNELYIP